MRKIKYNLSIGFTDASISDEFEVEDDATDEEIEEIAKEYVMGYIDWSWEEQDGD